MMKLPNMPRFNCRFFLYLRVGLYFAFVHAERMYFSEIARLFSLGGLAVALRLDEPTGVSPCIWFL